jgi:hypothetical protein
LASVVDLAEIQGEGLKLSQSLRHPCKRLGQSLIPEFRFGACRFQPFFQESQKPEERAATQAAP